MTHIYTNVISLALQKFNTLWTAKSAKTRAYLRNQTQNILWQVCTLVRSRNIMFTFSVVFTYQQRYLLVIHQMDKQAHDLRPMSWTFGTQDLNCIHKQIFWPQNGRWITNLNYAMKLLLANTVPTNINRWLLCQYLYLANVPVFFRDVTSSSIIIQTIIKTLSLKKRRCLCCHVW